MEPNEELLPQELAEVKATRAKIGLEAIIGLLALIIVVLGAIIWYLVAHHSPLIPSFPTATSTPPVATSTPNAVPLTLNESAAYYDITAQYPSSAGLPSAADTKAVESMKGFEQNTIDAFKEQGNFANLSHDDVQIMGLDQHKESLDIRYKVATSAHTRSYIYTIVEDTLGAHPNSYYRTFTYDTSTGTGLTLADLFASSVNYNDLLSTLTRKALPTIIAAREGVSASDVDAGMINSGTLPEDDSFQNWYLDGSNLVIIFPPYQVAAYAAGEIEVKIPLASISSKLVAAYR